MSFEALRTLWLWLSPANLLLIFGGLGFVFVCTPWRMFGRALLAIAALILVSVTYTPFAARMIKGLEDRFPAPLVAPGTVDGILVLGGAELSDVVLSRQLSSLADTMARQTRMIELMRAYPKARVVYAGAPADPDKPQLADSLGAQAVLRLHGLDPQRVQWVNNGLDTFEAMIYARDRAQPAPGQVWLLVTSAWHMPRAMAVAQRQGWKLIPQPVAELTGVKVSEPGYALTGLQLAERAMREWSALTVYAMFERTDRWVPVAGE